MANRIRVAIAGAGIGRHHAAAFENLSEMFEVRAIYDIDLARAQAAADAFEIPHVGTDINDLYNMPDVDLIDLCTPSGMHFAQTLRALEAGKDVILEKPVAGSLKEVDQLIAAEKRSGKRVTPIFQYRFWNGVQKLRHLAAQGITGNAYLTTVETCWRRRPAYYATWHGKWKSELGGPLVTLAVHANDILYYVLGPARSVFARAKTLVNPIETEDCVSASLEMADGSLASISVTTGSAHEITRHRFCFSRLTAESNTQPYRNTSDPWTFTGDTPEIDAEIEAALRDFAPQKEGFEGQFARYYAALQAGAPAPVTLADARNSLELITALYDSAWSGRVVDLPIREDHPMYAGWMEARS
jgi:predicted dehydrogenase